VFWGELPGLTKRRAFGNLARAALQVPIRNAAAIAAIGTEAVRAYEQLLPGIAVFNIPYFCDLKPFFAAAKNPRLEHRTGPIKFLYSGQIIERKGVDVLIRAFVKASSQAPNIRLEILGAGPLMDTLKSLAHGELQERITFIGFRQPEEIPELFAGCDVFVLPSRHDGWGVVVNEALGAGLSLVVSDRVGARDLVAPGVNGFVVKAGDVDDLASVLVRLATSDDLRKAQRRASKTMAAKWDVDEGVRRWLELTSRVLGARQCPPN
jgi:glycosyltransferase involved in cell wall biosynthesis